MQSTVLNFFMLNKNFVFVTSSTFETSLVPIQFSDVYVIQLLRIALLLVTYRITSCFGYFVIQTSIRIHYL